MTGCLRISRESIFTGLNNLKNHSILYDNYAEYFGFTEEEVEQMLKDYGIEAKMLEVKQWYDGYLFGDTEVYNPWSIINYVDAAVNDGNTGQIEERKYAAPFLDMGYQKLIKYGICFCEKTCMVKCVHQE